MAKEGKSLELRAKSLERTAKKAKVEERKVGRPHPKFSAGMTTNLEKARQLCNVIAAIGNLAEELRILRQTDGITSGEKKAIGAMLDKLGKFKDYAANCYIMNGGAK